MIYFLNKKKSKKYHTVRTRYDNVTLSPLLLPARVMNRCHSTHGSKLKLDTDLRIERRLETGRRSESYTNITRKAETAHMYTIHTLPIWLGRYITIEFGRVKLVL